MSPPDFHHHRPSLVIDFIFFIAGAVKRAVRVSCHSRLRPLLPPPPSQWKRLCKTGYNMKEMVSGFLVEAHSFPKELMLIIDELASVIPLDNGMVANWKEYLFKKNKEVFRLSLAFLEPSWIYPPVNEIVKQYEKFLLLERLLERLFARKHRVLIFNQWTKVLDILDYYLS
ncbi:hypothetical protein HN51_040381 [Arachis hypogaea]